MGDWKESQRAVDDKEVLKKQIRSQHRKPPSGFWQQSVPSWEKKFCTSVCLIPWRKLCETKKVMCLYKNVVQWNDSAGEEAFCNAKKRFWAEINGLPCDISLPDPDIYIDEIDWNSSDSVDPDLLLALDQETAVDNSEKDSKFELLGNGLDSLLFLNHPSDDPVPCTGWGDVDDTVRPVNDSAAELNWGNNENRSWGHSDWKKVDDNLRNPKGWENGNDNSPNHRGGKNYQDNLGNHRNWENGQEQSWDRIGWENSDGSLWNRSGWENVEENLRNRRGWDNEKDSSWNCRGWENGNENSWNQCSWEHGRDDSWNHGGWENGQDDSWNCRGWEKGVDNSWKRNDWENVDGNSWKPSDWENVDGTSWGCRRLEHETNDPVGLALKKNGGFLQNCRKREGVGRFGSRYNNPRFWPGEAYRINGGRRNCRGRKRTDFVHERNAFDEKPLTRRQWNTIEHLTQINHGLSGSGNLRT